LKTFHQTKVKEKENYFLSPVHFIIGYIDFSFAALTFIPIVWSEQYLGNIKGFAAWIKQ
ncbi:hypothetical protein T03_12283, partial [Trichinella britovi]